ncbi:unnamed protein product [Closterium sp. NIES-53]
MYLMTCTRADLAYPGYLCSTSCMGLVLGGRGPVVLTGHANASSVDDSATQRSSQGYTFSLGSGSASWRAMAAQELRWLTYLLTDLGEQPHSPPVLYVNNKAMIALCQEHRLEHRTKHIALRYFLAQELQQHGQLCLAYVATRANTADVFTKALPPGDHQRFATVLDLLALLFLTGLVTTCSPPLCLWGTTHICSLSSPVSPSPTSQCTSFSTRRAARASSSVCLISGPTTTSSVAAGTCVFYACVSLVSPIPSLPGGSIQLLPAEAPSALVTFVAMSAHPLSRCCYLSI